jgi:hypothetical protein
MIPPKALQTTPIALRDHSLSLIILHTNNSAATTMDNLKVYNDTIDLMEELNAKDRALALSEAWQLFSIPPYERRWHRSQRSESLWTKMLFGGTLDGDEEDMITRWDNNHEIVRNSIEV